MQSRGPLTTFPIYREAFSAISLLKKTYLRVVILGMLIPTFVVSLGKIYWSLNSLGEGALAGGLTELTTALTPYLQSVFFVQSLASLSLLVSFLILVNQNFGIRTGPSFGLVIKGVVLCGLLNLLSSERIFIGPFYLFTLMGSMAYVLMIAEKTSFLQSFKKALFLEYVPSQSPGLKLNVFFIFLNSGILFYAWGELVGYLFQNILTFDEWTGIPLQLWSFKEKSFLFFCFQRVMLATRDVLFVAPLAFWSACLASLYRAVRQDAL